MGCLLNYSRYVSYRYLIICVFAFLFSMNTSAQVNIDKAEYFSQGVIVDGTLNRTFVSWTVHEDPSADAVPLQVDVTKYP